MDALGEDTSVRQWAVQELTTIGDLLEAQNNLPGGEIAFKQASAYR
jgi:hypothetical protein